MLLFHRHVMNWLPRRRPVRMYSTSGTSTKVRFAGAAIGQRAAIRRCAARLYAVSHLGLPPVYQQHMLHEMEPGLPDIAHYACVTTSNYYLRRVQSEMWATHMSAFRLNIRRGQAELRPSSPVSTSSDIQPSCLLYTSDAADE